MMDPTLEAQLAQVRPYEPWFIMRIDFALIVLLALDLAFLIVADILARLVR